MFILLKHGSYLEQPRDNQSAIFFLLFERNIRVLHNAESCKRAEGKTGYSTCALNKY